MFSSKWPKILTFFSHKQLGTMKVQIKLSSDALQAIMNGKRVEGSLGLIPSSNNKSTKIGFRAYNRKPRVRERDRLVCHLEHGWVRESVERIKVYESVPKHLGAMGVGHVLQREAKAATDALLDLELDGLMFC